MPPLVSVPEDPSQNSVPVPVVERRRWHPMVLVGFRFSFVYLVLFVFPFPLKFEDAPDSLNVVWAKVVPWLGWHLFHLQIPTVYGGGDTLYGYGRVLLFAAMAGIATVIWSILDYNRKNYDTLHRWLRWWIAIYLGTMMLGYGIAKVLQDQMLPPSLSKLFVRFGDLSPQSLLWAFMGSSLTYTRFAGAVEVAGGILLFLPRLTTLGALITFGALTNVLLLDASYDVGVKLFCFNLLLVSLFLIVPAMPRLADLLVFGRPAKPVDRRSLFRRKWLNYGLVLTQVSLGAFAFRTFWNESYARQKNFYALAQTVPFYGIWTVDKLSINGQPRPLLVTDEDCWYRVIFDTPDGFDVPYDSQRFPAMAIISTSGTRRLYWLRFDRSSNILMLMKLDDSQRVGQDWTPTFQTSAQMKVEHTSADLLELDGQLDGNRIHAALRRTEMNFVLRTRGFHWIVNNAFWAR